jgi:hypothetical protein
LDGEDSDSDDDDVATADREIYAKACELIDAVVEITWVMLPVRNRSRLNAAEVQRK